MVADDFGIVMEYILSGTEILVERGDGDERETVELSKRFQSLLKKSEWKSRERKTTTEEILTTSSGHLVADCQGYIRAVVWLFGQAREERFEDDSRRATMDLRIQNFGREKVR